MQTYKVLGQAALAATTLTDIYVAPAATQTVVSTIVVCNRGAATTYRLAVAVAGAADDPKQYLVFDGAIGANESITFTIGVTLAATDIVRAYAAANTVTVSMFGAEVV